MNREHYEVVSLRESPTFHVYRVYSHYLFSTLML